MTDCYREDSSAALKGNRHDTVTLIIESGIQAHIYRAASVSLWNVLGRWPKNMAVTTSVCQRISDWVSFSQAIKNIRKALLPQPKSLSSPLSYFPMYTFNKTLPGSPKQARKAKKVTALPCCCPSQPGLSPNTHTHTTILLPLCRHHWIGGLWAMGNGDAYSPWIGREEAGSSIRSLHWLGAWHAASFRHMASVSNEGEQCMMGTLLLHPLFIWNRSSAEAEGYAELPPAALEGEGGCLCHISCPICSQQIGSRPTCPPELKRVANIQARGLLSWPPLQLCHSIQVLSHNVGRLQLSPALIVHGQQLLYMDDAFIYRSY